MMNSDKKGWSVNEWCDATSIGRTKTFELIGNKSIQSLTVGRRRIITTSPDDFFNKRTSEKQDRAND
ncbi:MAG: transcriptional regulator [Rhodospirillaceae bacterium]|nr:transcriptional regulator [Rhodospirillaceae bacterium]